MLRKPFFYFAILLILLVVHHGLAQDDTTNLYNPQSSPSSFSQDTELDLSPETAAELPVKDAKESFFEEDLDGEVSMEGGDADTRGSFLDEDGQYFFETFENNIADEEAATSIVTPEKHSLLEQPAEAPQLLTAPVLTKPETEALEQLRDALSLIEQDGYERGLAEGKELGKKACPAAAPAAAPTEATKPSAAYMTTGVYSFVIVCLASIR